MQLTVGGDKLKFYRPVSPPTSYLATSKLYCNSVISTPGTNYLVVDINNFYLNNLMPKHEYYHIALSLIPQDVIDKLNLVDNQINTFLYVML